MPIRAISVPPWATSTTRSLFSALARSSSSVTVSPAPPAATAILSRRAAEAAAALSRRDCCTSRSTLSQMTTPISSIAARAANAAS